MEDSQEETGWLTKADVEDLQRKLAWSEEENRPKRDDVIELLALKLEHTKVRLRPDKNHWRPHFHVEYKRGEHTASYAIGDRSRLAGYMPRKYEEPVLDWAARMEHALLATWDALKAGKMVTELILVADAPGAR